MRVIAGAYRGKKLAAPHGLTTRPTSDRVKEALFSILSSRIDFDGIAVLDICAGTGGLGIEALSRGAETCCFVDSDRSARVILEKNIQSVHCQERSEILTLDAVAALTVMRDRGTRFDLVFFDPPYHSDLYAKVPEALAVSGLLTADAFFVAECSARNELPASFGPLIRLERRVYGETALELFVLGA